MKTFKHTLQFKYLFLLVLFAIAALSSCKKDDSNAGISGSAYVMITNAAEGSSAQDFYLDNAKLNASAVAYTQSSSYLTASSGNRAAQFTNSGSTTANASFSMSLSGGQYYSVYYTGSASSNSYVVAQDDQSAPASGKAKVRFIHLASAAASTAVDFGISATNKLVTGLAYKAVSAYNTVDANTTFFLYASGSTTATLSIPVTIQAGKIYTIYVSGATTATLSYHIIAQN
ncbi:DUF4397 domain-containing protein [Mucilaginibacter mali]|uniref:DUF4397 domain-containing protein n=1 Tax=Mucilaginibacter mali TaxID=2740462 RepID=A0A7D4Q837_9SPHI|nr:DUF4397 domain-containing protein [Mucilaginibacter mali]QKJ28584.1 DUF4397 domain-containing protein [Mucilaginibacter mali]